MKIRLYILKRLIYLILFLVFNININAQCPDTLWTKTYGGTDWEEAFDIKKTHDNGFILSGWTSSFGAGNKDVYLVKVDSAGNVLWENTYGGPYEDVGFSVCQTEDRGYAISGATKSFAISGIDFYLIKTDSLGDTLWTRVFNDTLDDRAFSLLQTRDGGYIMTGWSCLHFCGGFSNLLVVKTDTQGYEEWRKVIGGLSNDRAWAIAPTYGNGYIITGWTDAFTGNSDLYLVKLDSTGNVEWDRAYGGEGMDIGRCVIQNSTDSGFVASGWTTSFGAGGDDVYILKTDKHGDSLWAHYYGGDSTDCIEDIKETYDGGYLLTGATNSYGLGLFDIYLLRTDDSGDTIYTGTYGGSGDDWANATQISENGNLFIGGASDSYTPNYLDFYLVKTGSYSLIEENLDDYNPVSLNVKPVFLFNGSSTTEIKYFLKQSMNIEINIYNNSGQLIKQILNVEVSPGIHTCLWDGKDMKGNSQSSGIYFVNLQAGSYSTSEKIVLIK